MKRNKHIGSNFDDFLKEEGIFAEVNAVAIKRVLVYAVTEEMRKKKITKTAMAELMKTSRTSLDRLLDPGNTSVTLATLIKAACVLDKDLKISFGSKTANTQPRKSAKLIMHRKKIVTKK